MRLFGAAVAGTVVAIGLFLLMSQLISGNSNVARRTDAALNFDFIRLDLDEVENIRRRIPPPEPKQVQRLSALPKLPVPQSNTMLNSFPRINAPAIDAAGVRLNISPELGRFDGTMPTGSLNEDGDLYPVLTVSPIYPSAARIRKVNGFVDLEYTVLPDGSVTDIVVLRSDPLSTFDDAAVHAISKWRFKPRVVNSRAMPTRVEQRINFNVFE